MSEKSVYDLLSRLDLIQQNLWSTEDKTIKNTAELSKLRIETEEIRAIVNIVNEKLDKIDQELRSLRDNQLN